MEMAHITEEDENVFRDYVGQGIDGDGHVTRDNGTSFKILWGKVRMGITQTCPLPIRLSAIDANPL